MAEKTSESIKYGILAVYAENNVWEDVDATIAYNCEMDELIKFIRNTFMEKLNAEVTDVRSEFNESDITEKIRFWCDGNEPVDTIFVIGYTIDYLSYEYENNSDAIQAIEKIITKQITKKYKDIQLLETLECPFQRSLCGKRYETRIFNFFGFSNEEVVTFIDSIVGVKYQVRLICQREMQQTVRSASCVSSSNNNNNADQVDESQIKSHEEAMLNPHTEKKNIRPNVTYESACSLTSPLTKEDDIKQKKRQSSFPPNKFTKMMEDVSRCYRESQLDLFSEMVHVDQVAEHGETSPADLITKQANIASEAATGAESSLSMRTEKSSLPDITMEEHLSTANQDDSDSESSWSESTYEEAEDTITVKDALVEIQRIVKSDEHERLYEYIDTEDAHGRILAETVHSNCNVPAFRAATKHGYAVLASDGEGERLVLHRTTSAPVSLTPGTCMYVMSGERVPDEATAVVSIKDVKEIISDNANNLILIKIKPEFGRNIKDIGSDIRKDKIIIPAFIRIGPAELGLLATTGRKKVLVMEPVPIGILSIGEFLVEPGEPLRPGFVYDSNRISLIALLKDKGFNLIMDFGIVTHDTQSISMKIEDALNQVDVLVTIGCTNDNDLLKPILVNNFDATIHFGNVFLKPGKSTTFATCTINDEMKYFVCLPKNPVSAFISAHLFLLPILNGIHRMFEMPCKIPARIQQRYILHQRPRATWANLQWKKRDNFARAYSKKNLRNDKPFSCQAANALLLLPQKTVDRKVLNKSFVPAYPIK